MSRTIVLAVVAAVALALGVGQASARSYPTAVEDLAGHWQGFFQSSVTGEIDTVTLDLTAAHDRQLRGHERHFNGIISREVQGSRLPLHVTVGASDVFTAVSPGGNFVAHGTQAGSNQGFGRWEVSFVHVLNAGGSTDMGTLNLVKSFPGEGAAQLPAALEGTFERDDGQTGRILVGIHWRFDSDFRGVAIFGDLSFPFLGSIGEPDDRGIAPVRALSVTPLATLLIRGEWILDSTLPPRMHGTVNATFADGSVRFINYSLS